MLKHINDIYENIYDFVPIRILGAWIFLIL